MIVIWQNNEYYWYEAWDVQVPNKMDDQALCLKQLVYNAWKARYITIIFILMDLIRKVRGEGDERLNSNQELGWGWGYM